MTLAHISTTKTLLPATFDQVSDVVQHFATFLAVGLRVSDMSSVRPEDADAFLDSLQTDGSPSTYALRRTRRMALRMAYRAGRELGIVEGDPTLDLDIGPGSYVRARPLTDEEIEVAHSYAARSRRDHRRSVAWALTEATGRMNEIGRVRVADLDLGRGRVRLPGSSTADARSGELTEWGLHQVERRLSVASEPNDSLIIWRSEPRVLPAACRQAVTETLRAAGLLGPEVKPRSVIAWRGRKAFEDGASIDAVARLLGMRSLDQAAEFIGIEWRGPG